MRVVLVAAVAENGVIGLRQALPWRLPKDLAFFRRTTLDGTVIVGRRTLDSMGGPLPRRKHIVLSRDPKFSREGFEPVVVVRNFDEALEVAHARGLRAVFVLGGAEIFRLALPRADELVLTRVLADVPGDVFFPEWSRDDFERTELERHLPDEANEYAIVMERWLRRPLR